jgi:hypothetical protein
VAEVGAAEEVEEEVVAFGDDVGCEGFGVFVVLTITISVGVGVFVGVTLGGKVGLGVEDNADVGVTLSEISGVTVGLKVGEIVPVGVKVNVGVGDGVVLGIREGCGDDEQVADFSSVAVPQSFVATTLQVYVLPDSGVWVTVILSVLEVAGISPSLTTPPPSLIV